jgi:hypothetical protein
MAHVNVEPYEFEFDSKTTALGAKLGIGESSIPFGEDRIGASRYGNSAKSSGRSLPSLMLTTLRRLMSAIAHWSLPSAAASSSSR